MLQISGTYGTYNTKILGVITEDKGVQTKEEGEAEDEEEDEPELSKDKNEEEVEEGFTKDSPQSS